MYIALVICFYAFNCIVQPIGAGQDENVNASATVSNEIQISWKQGRGFVRLGETGVMWNWQSDEGESIVRNRHGIQWALYKIRWSGMAGWKFCTVKTNAFFGVKILQFK